MGQDANGGNDAASHARLSGKAGFRRDWSGSLSDVAEGPVTAAAPPPLPIGTAAIAPVAPRPPAESVAVSHDTMPAITTQQAVGVYPAMYVFGDSLSDVGNLYANDSGTAPQAPYHAGTFSNGPLWIEDYAAHLDMPAPMPSLLHGTDFAYAGAQTGAPDLTSTTGHDLTEQVDAFVRDVPTPAPGALYVLDIGVNDLTQIITGGGSLTTMESEVSESVRTEANIIGALAARGGANFLVLNVPDIGRSPLENLGGPPQAALASTLAASYNAQLVATMVPGAVADHINLDIIDTYALIDQVTGDPAAYGFTNVTDPVWSGTGQGMDTGTLAATTQAAQDQYFFWDSLHPTETGQALIAGAAENLTFG